MARSKTAQPKHSLRKIAVVVATAVSGMSVYDRQRLNRKKTLSPLPLHLRRKKAHGGLLRLLRRDSLLPALKPIRRFKKCHVYFCCDRRRDGAASAEVGKEALSYTPGVSVGTRGASNTYDHLIIRGFAAEGQSQNNYLNGLKLQGNFYNDAVIDPYMLERAEIMRGPVSVLYGKSSPGGLLNMVSKRPTTEPLKEVQI